MSRVTYDWARFQSELKRTVSEQLDCIELLHLHGRPSPRRSKPGTCWAHCPAPDHPDHNPSCLVHRDRFYCFACDAKGDVFELLGLLLELPGSATFGDKVRAGLEVLGLDYEEEKTRFIELERGRASSPSPPKYAPALPSRAPVVSIKAHRDAPLHCASDAARTPSSVSVEMWQWMMDGLVLESEEAHYLRHERGFSIDLCQSVGLVSTTREVWQERLRALAARHDVEACLASGLFRLPREVPDALDSSDLLGHPYASRMLLLPYGHGGHLEGLRFRQTGECLDHQGARYLALLGRQNVVRAPYLASAQGGALIPPCGHRGLLYVCEGELDALSLVARGRAAIGIPGARAWRQEWGNSWKESYAHVILWADDDEAHKLASTRWLAQIASDLNQLHGPSWVAEHVHIASASGYPDCKDANDMLRAGLLEAHLEHLERGILDK